MLKPCNCRCGASYGSRELDDSVGIHCGTGVLPQVWCIKCGIQGPYGQSAEEAIKKWNEMWNDQDGKERG